MITLKDTMVDLADCHTTLYYLGQKPPQVAPLPLGSEDEYRGLYREISPPSVKLYGDLRQGHAASILHKLRPAYADNKYWYKYMATSNYKSYAATVWRKLVPVKATLTARVEFVPDGKFNFKVSPVPSVLIYPFGWTTWLSLRLTGEHSLADLNAFMQYLFDTHAKPFRLVPPAPGQPFALSLRHLFDFVAQGVRADAFGGDETDDADSQGVVTVVTVLAKHGGNLSLGALSDDEQKLLRRVISPEGPPPSSPFEEHIYRVNPNSLVDYVVADGYGRFVWLDSLLSPVGRNYQKLRCHHNNTLISLVQALHLREMIDAAVKVKSPPDALKEMLEQARERLDDPPYRSASLLLFLEDPSVKASVEKAAKL